MLEWERTPPTLRAAGTALLLVVSSAAAPAPTLAGDWVTYVDETSTRLVSDASVGSADSEEKDLTVGDVDKDGDADMIIVRKRPFSTPGGRPNVLFLNENGVMTDRTATLAPDFLESTDDRDATLVDVDGDTWPDLVTATTFSEQPRVHMNLGEDKEGNWLGFEWDPGDVRIPPFSPAPKFCAVNWGDVNRDGAQDLFFVDYDNNLEDRLLINNGSGFFTDETDLRMTPEMSESVFGTDGHIVDVNGDLWPDIVKNSASGSAPPPGSTEPSVRVLYNDGTGNFDFLDFVYTEAPYMVEPADFTGDGRIDLFAVDDGQDAFLINNGNDGNDHVIWNIQEVTNSPNTEGFGGNVKFADLDGDDILDVLVSDVDTDIPGCDRTLTLLQGQGPKPNVTYSDPLNGVSRPWLPDGVFDIEAMHINNDGVLDLWIATCDGSRIFIATHAGPGFFADGFESGDTSNWTSTAP